MEGIVRGSEMRTGHKRICNQKGTSLIELMIAMLVLTVGLIGSVALMAVSINSNSRSKTDSTSAAAAEMVIGNLRRSIGRRHYKRHGYRLCRERRDR